MHGKNKYDNFWRGKIKKTLDIISDKRNPQYDRLRIQKFNNVI